VIVSGRSGDSILLGVGNWLISFVGGSAESFDLGIVIWSIFEVDLSRIDLSLDLSL
jgi:hypothetical protein